MKPIKIEVEFSGKLQEAIVDAVLDFINYHVVEISIRSLFDKYMK